MLPLRSCITVYFLFLKDMALKHAACHINNSDPSHTRLKQQLDKNLKITFASPSKSAEEKKKDSKIIAIAKLFALHANAINLKHSSICEAFDRI